MFEPITMDLLYMITEKIELITMDLLYMITEKIELITIQSWGLSGRDRMVVGFITTYAISAYHH